MFYLAFLAFVLLVLVFIVLSLSLILSMKMAFSREKSSPFECGFDNMGSARLPFSLRFFLLTIIFLIFDVEVVLLLPSVTTYNVCSVSEWAFIFLVFLTVLVGGLLHEWSKGALNWSL